LRMQASASISNNKFSNSTNQQINQSTNKSHAPAWDCVDFWTVFLDVSYEWSFTNIQKDISQIQYGKSAHYLRMQASASISNNKFSNSTNQPINQSTNSTNQPINQSTNQPTQPINQSTNQPTNPTPRRGICL